MPLGVSLLGRRFEGQCEGKPIDSVAFNRVMERVEDDSAFFDQMTPNALPNFSLSETELHDFLGNGEFGEVWGVKALHVAQECPCSNCREQRKSLSPAAGVVSPPESETLHTQIAAPETALGITTAETATDDSASSSLEHERDLFFIDIPTATLQSTSRNPQHRQVVSTVSNGEDVKVQEAYDDDASTLSTEDADSLFNQQDDDNEDDDSDGEVALLRGYLSTHVSRGGFGRYAVKRVRRDLTPRRLLLIAAVDLAVEAKFLAAVRHPNIVRMRGTVGAPGSLDFMILMDRLTISLREKMGSWNNEAKRKSGILGRVLPTIGNKALREDQYADKLLAMYDIARAMRYLHNYMILYRDLKPENVAVDIRGDMRLFDFGLVKELKARDLVEPPDSFSATGLVGSRRYMAPEVALCKNYGLAADVYSFAILFWEVFSGQEAYSKMDTEQHFDQVVLKGRRPRKKAASFGLLPKSLVRLLESMWAPDPKDRPSFRTICNRLSNEHILSSHQHQSGSVRSNKSHLSDRTRYLLNRSLNSRYAADSNASASSYNGGSRCGSQIDLHEM